MKKKGFLEGWLGKGWKEHPVAAAERLSRYTIGNDKWDREDFERLLDEMRDFAVQREKLVQNGAGDVGHDVWGDAYWSFVKVDPKVQPANTIRPSHIVNRFVIEEAQQLPEFQELRGWTVGDDVGSALACVTIEPDLETLYDKLANERQQAQQMQQMLQQLADTMQEQRDNEEIWNDWAETASEEEQAEARADHQAKQDLLDQMIQQMIEDLDDAGEALQAGLEGQRQGVRSAMRSAMRKASDDATDMSASADLWGLEPGQLQRMPHDQRIAMAKRLNTPKFKKIAALFGPMRRMAFTEQRRRVNYVPEEIFDITIGNDLPRVLASELANLEDEWRELLFFKRWIEGSLLQYEMRGFEKVAKGGIICAIDGSGSMKGDREIWAKAVGLCLLHIAKKQKRPFYGIQFGSSHEIREYDFDTVKNGVVDTQMVIDFAEFFFDGGTDFMRPLSIALDRLRDEHQREGRVKGDIVFVTDGQCMVHPDWLKAFKEEQKRLGFTVWCVLIGAGWREGDSIDQVSDGRVLTIQQLTSGEDVREIFAGIGTR